MAKRTAQLDIKVTGAQTLGQIEDELTQINEELKGVDVNSKAFKDLSKQAQKAKFSLDEVNNSIEGVTNVKRAEGAKKLGEGLVGGFAAASAAAALYGDESSEALQKATQKAVLMFTALDGLEKVSKAFSKEATDGLKSIVVGFTKSIKSVRLFGLSSAASLALATAGITILIAGVIALVANFDKVTAWFKDLAEELPVLQWIVDGFTAIGDAIGFIDNLWDGFIGGMKSLGDESKTFADGFKEALDASIEYEAQEEKLEKFRKEGIKDLERELKIAESLKDNDEDVFNLKKKILKTEIDLLKNTGKISKAEKEKLKDLETSLTVLKNQNGERLEAIKNQKNQNEIDKQNQIEQQKVDAIKKIDEDNKIKILEERLKIEKAIRDENNFTKGISDDLLGLLKEFYLTNLNIKENEIILKALKEDDKDNRADIIKLEIQSLELHDKKIKIQKDIAEQANIEQKQLDKSKEIIIDMTDSADDLSEKYSIVTTNLVDGKNVVRDMWGEMQKTREEIIGTGTDAEVLALRLEETALAISLIGDIAGVGFEAMLVGLDNELLRLDNDLAEIQKRQSDYNDSEIDFQKLLADANGERHAEIKEQMIAQDDLRNSLEQEEINKKNEIIRAENEQAKIQKQQAVVDSVINTALAVVQALPNIPLSIIVGGLGLAATGTIIGKKLPLQKEIESKAEGGYTEKGGKNDVAGIVHKSEYVVPKNVLESDTGAQMVEILEGMRKGFADGGYTSDVPITTTSPSIAAQFSDVPIYVSWTEGREVGRNVEVIESRGSL